MALTVLSLAVASSLRTGIISSSTVGLGSLGSCSSSRWLSRETFPIPGERTILDEAAQTTEEGHGTQPYLTWALTTDPGVHFKSEASKLQVGRLQTNKPFLVTVLWKKHTKSLTCIRRIRTFHPKYQRYYDKIRKIQVHDPYDECVAGDMIFIKQSRPYSKTKAHVVDKVYRKEASRGYLDEHPEATITNELRRVLDEKKKAVRHSTVYMSDVQELYLERELRRIDDSYEKALAGAAQSAQDRQNRLDDIAAAKERDRQSELHRRRQVPDRSWEKKGKLEPWRFDPYAQGRRRSFKFR